MVRVPTATLVHAPRPARARRRRRAAGPALLVTAALLSGCGAAVPGEADRAAGADGTVGAGSSASPTTVAPPAPARLPTAPPAPAPSPTPEPPPEPTFEHTVREIDDELRAAMVPTVWREGCPTPLADLRHLTMTHWDFEGEVQTGRIVVHESVADQVVRVFERLFEARYPIRQMRPMEEFDGDVDAGLAADNTSSFNCRKMLLSERWSEHAHGLAIDVNPLENPYWRPDSGYVNPPEGAPYVERPAHPAVIADGDVVVEAFAAEGWKWGGHWNSWLDWMHFSPSGV